MMPTLFELGKAERHSINDICWYVDTEDWRTIFVKYVPFWSYARCDEASQRVGMAMLAVNQIASVRDIGQGFGVSHGFVHKLAKRLRQEGLDGVYADKPGPQGPSKMTREIRRFAWRQLNKGKSTRGVADSIQERFGVEISHNTIAIFKRKKALPKAEPPVEAEQVSLLPEAASRIMTAKKLEGVGTQYGGAFLYFAALQQLDVVSTWNRVMFWKQKLGYLLSEVVLTLLFLMILRYPTVESSKKVLRRHLAPLLGLESAPSMATLRRKIGYLAAQKQGQELLRAHAEQAKKAKLIELGGLYVDGHFKPYYGQESISKGYFSQRRLAHPGVMQYFVNDVDGRPILFLIEEAHVGLIKALPSILDEIRAVAGDERPLTLVFDRGGWSLELFEWLQQQGDICFITYEKGRGQEKCPEEQFKSSWLTVAGKRKVYGVCDGRRVYSTCGELRRIVVRRGDKQTAIVTNDTRRKAASVAYLMFHRWGQENFFGYMKEQYQLDALIGYGDEPADGERQVPNPVKKAMKKQMKEIEEAIEFFQGQLGEAVLDRYHQDRSVAALKAAEGGVGKVRELSRELKQLKREYRNIPAKVALKELVPQAEIRRLKLEKKILVDILKMQAYLAEDLMVQRLAKHYDDADDIRQVLQVLVRCPAQLSTTEQTLTVELEPPERPKYARALEALCHELNVDGVKLPWGGRRLIFKLASVGTFTTEVSTAA